MQTKYSEMDLVGLKAAYSFCRKCTPYIEIMEYNEIARQRGYKSFWQMILDNNPAKCLGLPSEMSAIKRRVLNSIVD